MDSPQDREKYRIVRAGAERGAGQTHFEDNASMELKNSHMIELSAQVLMYQVVPRELFKIIECLYFCNSSRTHLSYPPLIAFEKVQHIVFTSGAGEGVNN